jgi:hypothetical protein
MQLSGDRYIPKMNVSPEADAEFMRLLEKEDPKRYANLIRNMRQSISRATVSVEVTGRKRRRDAKFQTAAEKQAAYRARQAVAA